MEVKLLTADRFVDMEAGCSYRYVHSDTEYFRPHYHDYYELFLMLEGTALHKVNGSKIKLPKGSLVLIRPKDSHDYLSIGGNPFSFLNITFTADLARQIFDYLGDGFPSGWLQESPLPPEVHLSDYEFARLGRRMDNIRSLDPLDRDKKKTMLRILLFDIFARHFQSAAPVREQMPLWLEEMCTTIRKDGNFAQGSVYFFSLTDRSREHVSRCMKRYTGMTVSEFINTLRLNYIANMLRDSNHGISQIIFDSGFNNISWASNQFRRKYGMTMTQYRTGARENDIEST